MSEANSEAGHERGGPFLQADAPVASGSDDRLGRGGIVDTIATHIESYRSGESLVIALNAPWGAGKTSCLNLLEARLKDGQRSRSDMPATRLTALRRWLPFGPSSWWPVWTVPDGAPDEGALAVVRFEPWLYGDVEQLVRLFFRTLSRGVGMNDRSESRAKLGRRLEEFGKMVTTATVGAGAGVGTFIQIAGSRLAKEQTLEDAKEEINGYLAKLSRSVVVFIDDIDRLERDTLRLLFRLIRLNADFKNVIYVLPFDRAVVERQLGDDGGISGRDYLEKIIQVSIDLPSPEPPALRRIFVHEGKARLKHLDPIPFDENLFLDRFGHGFWAHVRTVRQVKRFWNGLSLAITPVVRDVDLHDFMAVELLRQFHPDVYWLVARGQEVFAPHSPFETDDLRRQRSIYVNEVVALAGDQGVAVRELLQELFPMMERAGDQRDSRSKRCLAAVLAGGSPISSSKAFSRYFLLAVPEGDISAAQVDAFVDQLGDVKVATTALRQASDAMLGALLRRVELLSREQCVVVTRALVDVAGAIVDGRSCPEHTGAICVTAELRTLPEVREVTSSTFSLMEDLVKAAAGRSGDVGLVQEYVRDGASIGVAVWLAVLVEPRSDEADDVWLAAWPALRPLAIDRVSAAADDGSLWRSRQPITALLAWERWTDNDTVRGAVADATQDDERLLQFLDVFVEAEHPDRRCIRAHYLREFVDIRAVIERLRAMDSDGSRAEARELLELLEAAMGQP